MSVKDCFSVITHETLLQTSCDLPNTDLLSSGPARQTHCVYAKKKKRGERETHTRKVDCKLFIFDMLGQALSLPFVAL